MEPMKSPRSFVLKDVNKVIPTLVLKLIFIFILINMIMHAMHVGRKPCYIIDLDCIENEMKGRNMNGNTHREIL
jgi:hypothetical protein